MSNLFLLLIIFINPNLLVKGIKDVDYPIKGPQVVLGALAESMLNTTGPIVIVGGIQVQGYILESEWKLMAPNVPTVK